MEIDDYKHEFVKLSNDQVFFVYSIHHDSETIFLNKSDRITNEWNGHWINISDFLLWKPEIVE